MDETWLAGLGLKLKGDAKAAVGEGLADLSTDQLLSFETSLEISPSRHVGELYWGSKSCDGVQEREAVVAPQAEDKVETKVGEVELFATDLKGVPWEVKVDNAVTA